MERSGDAIAVKSLRPVFLYCFTAGCAVIFAYILTAFQSTTPVGARAFRQTLLFLLLGTAIGYFLAQMLLKKSIAVFRGAKTWVGSAQCVWCLRSAAQPRDMMCLGLLRPRTGRERRFLHRQFLPRPDDRSCGH